MYPRFENYQNNAASLNEFERIWLYDKSLKNDPNPNCKILVTAAWRSDTKLSGRHDQKLVDVLIRTS